MRMMASFYRAYPGRTTVMLLALLLSGVAEGVGLSALLPLLNIAVGQDVSAAVTGIKPLIIMARINRPALRLFIV